MSKLYGQYQTRSIPTGQLSTNTLISFLFQPLEMTNLLQPSRGEAVMTCVFFSKRDYPSGHFFGGRGRGEKTPGWAEEMMCGQSQTVDVPPMSELLTMASCRKDWKRISAESSLIIIIPHAQNPTIQTQDSRLSHFHLLWTLCLEFTPTRHQAMLNSYIF